MKPVVIIAIAVGCSVVAVLGILFALELYRVSEAQKAYNIELERQTVCERLYDNTGNLNEIELWGICLNYGIDQAIESDNRCGTASSNSVDLCKIKSKLFAIGIIEQEITLDQEFREKMISQKKGLESMKSYLEKEKDDLEAKFERMKILEQEWISKYTNEKMSDWNSIYAECMNSDFEEYETEFLHNNFCKNSLEKAMNKSCNYKSHTCIGMTNNIMNNYPLFNHVGNSEDDLFDSYSKSCKSNPDSDYWECMCQIQLDSREWARLCGN